MTAHGVSRNLLAKDAAAAIEGLRVKLAADGWDRLRGARLTSLIHQATLGRELPEQLRSLQKRLQLAVPRKQLEEASFRQILDDCARLEKLLCAPDAPPRRLVWILGDAPTGWDQVLPLLSVQHAQVSRHEELDCHADDILLTRTGWLAGLDLKTMESFLAVAKACQEWIVLTSGNLSFSYQLELMRNGVTRLVNDDIDPRQLAGLLAEIGDRGRSEPYRVMVVDDEQSQLDLYLALLREAGIEAIGTSDPMVALEYIEEFRPEVLLVDVVMPVCSGPELVRLLRQNPDLIYLPVIYITASNERSHMLAAGHSEAEGYISKPVDTELLVVRVRAQARRFRHQNRLEKGNAATLASLNVVEMAVSHHAILTVTDREGRIIQTNDLFCAAIGYTSAEIIGKNHRKFKSDVHPPEFFDELWRTICGNRVWQGEVCDRRKDGALVWFNTTIIPLADSEGIPYQYVSVRTNITAARLAQHEAEAANNAKTAFLSNMSHELRTPMNAIMGFTQVLDADEHLNADQRESVQEIWRASQHLLKLINEVLDLAKVESGHLSLAIESLPVGSLVEECLSMVAVLAENLGIPMLCERVPPVLVRADRVRLKQSLINLLSNAIKYNRKGGEVRLDVAVSDDQAVFTVIDTGPGIPRERLAELFQPFHRLGAEHSDVEGSGIGLALTRRLVEAMHGTLEVDSQLSIGSRFWITLPLDRASARQSETRAHS